MRIELEKKFDVSSRDGIRQISGSWIISAIFRKQQKKFKKIIEKNFFFF